jgi:hypothetical protein
MPLACIHVIVKFACLRVHSVGSIAPLRQCLRTTYINVCVAVLNLMRSAHQRQTSMAMTNGNAAYVSTYTTKCESVTKPPYSMNGPGQVLTKPPHCQRGPLVKIHSNHSGNPPVSIPSNTWTMPPSAAQLHRVTLFVLFSI